MSKENLKIAAALFDQIDSIKKLQEDNIESTKNLSNGIVNCPAYGMVHQFSERRKQSFDHFVIERDSVAESYLKELEDMELYSLEELKAINLKMNEAIERLIAREIDFCENLANEILAK